MLALIPITVALVGAQQSVTLRYNPAPGVKYKQRLTTTAKQSFGAQAMTSTSEMHFTNRVISNDKGAIVSESVIDNYTMTTSPATPGTEGAGKKLIGAKWRTTMDSSGNIKSVKPLSDDPAAKMVTGSMGSGMNGLDFPKTPVHVGSTWKTTVDPSKAMGAAMQGMKMKTTGAIYMTYKVLKIGPSTVDLALTIGGNMIMDMGQVKVKMTINGTGVTSVYKSNGVSPKMDLTANYLVNMGGGRSMNQQMTMKMAIE